MNIVVIGAGGIGGYFGGKLANSGNDVTFVARGNHLEAIKSKGLQVKSILGDFIVYPKATNDLNDVKKPDLIILGVKSWQVDEVAIQIKPILNKETLVLPIQNGADNADKLLKHLNAQNILTGMCKIVSKIESPGVINHFAFEPEIVFGELDNKKSNRIKSVATILNSAGIKNDIPNDIHLDIWKKFLFITTVSGIGALTRSVFGIMREDNILREIMFKTANEIINVANAKGINLSVNDIDKVMHVVDKLDYNTTASMQRDIMDGRPSELENFNGYIVKQGDILNIGTPINSFIYHCLLPMENKARS